MSFTWALRRGRPRNYGAQGREQRRGIDVGVSMLFMHVVLLSVDTLFLTRCFERRLAPVTQETLEETLSVEGQGGVTVRRDGNGNVEHWQYGYRYLVRYSLTTYPLVLLHPSPIQQSLLYLAV